MLKLKCTQSFQIDQLTYIIEGEVWGVQCIDKGIVYITCLHGINLGLELELDLESISEFFKVMDAQL
jgi:hypothetical protein